MCVQEWLIWGLRLVAGVPSVHGTRCAQSHTHQSHERGQWSQVNQGISCNYDGMMMVVKVVKVNTFFSFVMLSNCIGLTLVLRQVWRFDGWDKLWLIAQYSPWSASAAPATWPQPLDQLSNLLNCCKTFNFVYWAENNQDQAKTKKSLLAAQKYFFNLFYFKSS